MEASLKLWSESTSMGLDGGAAHTRHGSSGPPAQPEVLTLECVSICSRR